MLFHNGLLHLGVNISAFIAAYNLALRFGTVRGCMLWSFVSAVIGTRLSMSALPTIGGSGYVYGMFGYIAGHMLGGLLSGRYVLNPEKIRVWIALLSAVTLLAVPFFVPQANAPLHISCFMLSLSAGGLKELIIYESKNKK
jgi:membrane associated rhomboid family serine protease